MTKKIKRIGKFWATESTIKRSSLQNLIVEKLDLAKPGPIIVRKKKVEYHVYGTNRKEYLTLLEQVKEKLHKPEKETKNEI